MKRNIVFAIAIAIVVALFASCQQGEVVANAVGIGFVRFSDLNYVASSKAVDLLAHIDYPDELSLSWTVSATKTGTGNKVGEGVYEDVLLTDTLGPFSVGSWHFTLEGRDEKDRLIYTGSADTSIAEGSNTVHAEVAPPEEGNGTLRLEDCNFDPAIGDCFRILYDDNPVANFSLSYCSVREDGLYDVPDTNIQIPGGIRTIRVYLGTTLVRTFRVRILPNITTVMTYGTFEGTAFLELSVLKYDAIVEDE